MRPFASALRLVENFTNLRFMKTLFSDFSDRGVSMWEVEPAVTKLSFNISVDGKVGLAEIKFAK